ncbi:MAG: cysteine hydrolase family protein [Hyphomicrobiaceae bacterium]
MIDGFDDLTQHTGAAPFVPVTFDLVPGRTVMLHIDAQNDFLHPEGQYAQKQINIDHMRRVIDPTRRLVDASRAHDIPHIWTRHGTRGAVDAGTFHTLRPHLGDAGLRQGTWGYQLYEGIGARDDDWFVEKTRLSAFFQTNLELILRGLGVETIVMTGVLTNQCVAATSKDAMFRDFRVVVVEECTGTTLPNLHAPALAMMKIGWAEVAGLDDILERVGRLPKAAGAT